MAGKKPLSPAEWGKSHPARTHGVQCYICVRPELDKIVRYCVDRLGWDCSRTCDYIREQHGYPRKKNAVLIHVREHRK